MTLHIISAELNSMQLNRLSAMFCSGDNIILSDGGALNLSQLQASLLAHTYMLATDIECRGLTKLPSTITVIDYTEFVRLSSHHTNSISWY